MLSHLRFHRRAPSNPTSPLPDQNPVWDPAAQRERPPNIRDVSPHPPYPPHPNPRPRSPAASRLPPTLPPIVRVASPDSDASFAPLDNTPPPPRAGYDDGNKQGFIGGVALRKYQAAQEPHRAGPVRAMTAPLPENQLSRAKPAPPPINTGARPAAPTKQSKSSWFSTPTDLQPPGGPAKRPAGPRVTAEPAPGAASEPQKGRKGLPFLKNPMSSLLSRRKTPQTVVETQPPPPTYDPRIKGTRVHDFSAPRPKKTVSSPDAVPAAKQETTSTAARPADRSQSAPDSLLGGKVGSFPEPGRNAVDRVEPGAYADGTREKTLSSSTVWPDHTTHLTSPDDDLPTSIHTSPSAASRSAPMAAPPPAASMSTRTIASRQLSTSGVSRKDSVASAIPRHMKSTSSRFSFDMGGAAQQEKLLEERHRQREQEKKTSDGPDADADARFADFDEDFDYDAMIDDDGLEERIPGVNADYDDNYDDYDDYEGGLDADMDPDNDQENFAGFVFQRSGPSSSLASPHTPALLATPRDANGAAIGFAMTKDTTPDPASAGSPMLPSFPVSPPQDDVSVPVIQEQEPEAPDDSQAPVFRPSVPAATGPQPPARSEKDDIYFDDGLADELDFEHDGAYFDESIFDNHDTDQYGRPIPGAFAQAKEAMRAAYHTQKQEEQEPPKRDSDMIPGESGHSGTARSTRDTSLSVGPQMPLVQQDVEEHSSKKPSAEPAMDIPSQEFDYQAALAAAAQVAAASGKFRRSASPEEPADACPADPLESAEPEANGYDDYSDDFVTNNFDDYGDDAGFDDFDFDDEGIIAEANASALANDADGFYGQEFGFYSAPAPAPHHQPPPSASASTSPTENIYHYSAGGYFIPATALNRSTSGRVVSREPNLTPITERSEYSNRNSVMSFTLPPAVGDGPGGRNSLSSPIPGLAQLALLPEDEVGGDMTFEALMRLRSKAWGGGGGGGGAGAGASGQGSVDSSREGSPRSERVIMDGYGTVPAHLVHGHGHARVGSALSMWSCSEGGGSGRGSPVMAGGVIPAVPAAGLLPPRPGSAGAVPNGGGASASGTGLAAPLPLRPHSFSLPPLPLLVPPQLPQQQQQSPQIGGGACSPVLEGDEAETGPAGDEFALAPAWPARASLAEGSNK